MADQVSEAIECLLVGDGPIKVVVAHGWMGDHHLFDDVIPLIDQDRYSFAFFDCRGYGIRLREVGPMTVEAIAADVVKVADANGWERFHVVGHSMGGMSAQRLMIDFPERVASAVLVAPVPASGAKIDDARRALLREAMDSPAARRKLIDANTGQARDDAWLDRILDLSLESTNPQALEAYMASWTGTDFSAEAKGCRVRALVLLGELDPGAPPERIKATLMSWYPRAELVQLEGCGHYPMIETPEHFIAAATAFLST